MKKKLLSLLSEPIILGSFWVTTGNLVTSFLNYLFNILMGRFLTTEEYGIYISLISLTIIISLPAGIITTIVTKLSADFVSKNRLSKLARLAQRLTMYTFGAGICLSIVLFLFSSQLSDFLKLDNNTYIYIAIVIVFMGLVGSVNRGLLQGMLYFKLISFLNGLSAVIKLVLGWIFVTIQLKVAAPLWAFLISGIIPWFISFIPLGKLFTMRAHGSFGLRGKIITLSIPSFSLNSAMLLFLSADILLVKHFFSPDEAGIFAASSIMGKVIFYVTGPIVGILLPIISQGRGQARRWIKDLTLSMILISIPSFFGVVCYYLFPTFIQSFLFPNNQYETAGNYIALYSMYMFFFTIAMLFANFFLAYEKNNLVHLALVASFVQIVLISFYHPTLESVIIDSIVAAAGMLIVYISYTILIFGKNEKH